MGDSSRVMTNSGDIALSRTEFIRTMALSTFVMVLVVGVGAHLTWTWELSMALLLISFLGCLGCIGLFTTSDNPIVSAIGVGGMSFLLGMQIGPLFGHYAAMYKGIVLETLVVTGGIMVSMSAAGIFFPFFFEGFGPYLMAGLWTLIWVQLGQLLLGACGVTAALNVPIVTWAGVLLFMLFVAYDWADALKKPHTLDNAIDASGGLVLDFVNLAIRILQIFVDAKK